MEAYSDQFYDHGEEVGNVGLLSVDSDGKDGDEGSEEEEKLSDHLNKGQSFPLEVFGDGLARDQLYLLTIF